MVDILVFVLALAGTFFTLYGLMFFVLALFPGKPPIDKSNIWNRLIAPVYVAKHSEVFGGINFWKNDVGENIKLVEQAIRYKLDIEDAFQVKQLTVSKPQTSNLGTIILSTILCGKCQSLDQAKYVGETLHCIFRGSSEVKMKWIQWVISSGDPEDFDYSKYWDNLTQQMNM